MRKIILLIALAVLTAGSMIAQNDTTSNKKEKGKFGSFMRKLGETSTGINMTDEPFIVNPLRSSIDVEFVGAYGDPSTGGVTIVIKVKNKTYEKYTGFGGYDALTAFDKNGKTYKGGSATEKELDTPKDLWVEVKLDGYHKIQKVPESLAAFELINLNCKIARKSSLSGTIELRNIPIQWGVTPE